MVNVVTAYNDYKNEIPSVRLKYATAYLQPTQTLLSNGEELYYESIDILDKNTTTQIEIFAYETVEVFLVLEANLFNDEVVVLDEVSFKTPLKLYASVYEYDVGPDYIKINFYPDFYNRTDITYYLNLYKDGNILDTKTIKYIESSEEHFFVFEYNDLDENSLYHFSVIAEYMVFDKLHEVEEEVNSLDVYTTPVYSYSVSAQKSDTQLIVTLILDDPNSVLYDFYYYIYIVEEDNEIYYNGTEGVIIDNQVIMQVEITDEVVYKVDIYASKKINENISYTWLQIESIVK